MTSSVSSASSIWLLEINEPSLFRFPNPLTDRILRSRQNPAELESKMPGPGIPGNAESVGLGVRQTGLIKLEAPVLVPPEDDDGPVNPFGTNAFFCAPANPGDLFRRATDDKDPAVVCEPVDGEGKQIEELLDAIRAPIEYEETGQRFRQRISREPATREDIIHLHRQLNSLLKDRAARPDGLCPIRRELYVQCFDELIRQIAINSPERGLLLLRVRAEVEMTASTLQALHETAVAFGIQQADQYIALKPEAVEQVEELRTEKAELEKVLAKLQEDLEHLDESFIHKKQGVDKVHFDKLQLIKRTQQMLKKHLDHVVNPVDETKKKKAHEDDSDTDSDEEESPKSETTPTPPKV